MTAATPLVNVLFGTVTGNAEEIARRIHADLAKKPLRQGLLRCLSDFADIPAFIKPSQHSSDTYNVIVVSTTGDGDPPDTIRPFMRLLRNKDKSRLSGLNFTVLALGDTNYENFCKTGKRVDAALPKLGARRFLDRGDADDGVGLELVVEPWLKKLWKSLESLTASVTQEDENMDTNAVVVPNSVVEDIVKCVTAQSLGFDESKLPPIPPSKISLEVIDRGETLITDDVLSVHPSYSPSVSRIATLKNARLLTASDSEKTVWHIELACDQHSSSSSTPMSYRPGDAFGLFVENNDSEVARFLKATHFDPNQFVRILNQNGDTLVTASVEKIVRQRLDIRAIPSKTLLRVLSEYTTDKTERRQLLQLSSRVGRVEYTQFISRKNTTILDVLETMAPSCNAPVNIYIDLLPAIPQRWYSATSSPILDGENIVHFAFSVVENGLATNALARRCEAFLSGEESKTELSSVIISPRESDSSSHFHPPESLHTSYIMIGPGTGVAPFRGFLRERQSLVKDASDEDVQSLGKTLLFFGCRHKEKDFLYQDDLQDLVESNVLNKLIMAFSRDEEKKVYVQDRLLEHKQHVAELIRDGATVFVCGDGGGMAMGVNKVLTTIVTELLCDGDESNGKDLMKRLAEEHRYVRDIWYFG